MISVSQLLNYSLRYKLLKPIQDIAIELYLFEVLFTNYKYICFFYNIKRYSIITIVISNPLVE